MKEIFNPKKSYALNFTDSYDYLRYSKTNYNFFEVEHQFLALLEEKDSLDVKINNFILNKALRKSYVPFYELQGHPVYQKIEFHGYRGGTEAICHDLNKYFANGNSILRCATEKWERYHRVKRYYLKKTDSRNYAYDYRKKPPYKISDLPNKKVTRTEYVPLGKTPSTVTIAQSNNRFIITNYRIEGDEFVKFGLGDLLIEGFESSLSAMCFDELDKVPSFEMDCMKLDALVTRKTDKFILYQDSICIFFMNTANRSWDQPVTLPYTQIQNLLKPDAWVQKMVGKL
ncbi:MAG: hypothetical protein JKY54_07065 [Flavobacteriales bacterium]|nr:hypothetical protein [Flavobacteriales bacterium]